jgi:hypothetical protein
VEECTYLWGVNTSWGINTAESKRPINQEDNQAPQPIVVVFANDDYFKNQIAGKDIMQLKNNTIPKGLVPLEKLFDNNDVAKSPKITANDGDVEDCNIGTQEDPNIIKLSKTLSLEVKKRYISLMKEFPDVFAWSYEDLKV